MEHNFKNDFYGTRLVCFLFKKTYVKNTYVANIVENQIENEESVTIY